MSKYREEFKSDKEEKLVQSSIENRQKQSRLLAIGSLIVSAGALSLSAFDTIHDVDDHTVEREHSQGSLILTIFSLLVGLTAVVASFFAGGKAKEAESKLYASMPNSIVTLENVSKSDYTNDKGFFVERYNGEPIKEIGRLR